MPAALIGLARAVLVSAFLGALGCPAAAYAQHTLQATLAKTPPLIDGDVTDEEWAAGALASGFVQFEPRRGDPSAFPTRVTRCS